MSSPSSPSSPAGVFLESPWQSRLKEHCRNYKMNAPSWRLMSDKRGGRTAWSSIVTIEGQDVHARYWYDGQFSNNAKEDAAEVALQLLKVIPSPRLSPHARVYPYPPNFRASQ